MNATTIDFSNRTHSGAARTALSANIVPGVILALLIGATVGLLSFLLGLGNIISGMLGALGALALVWFGARCITNAAKRAVQPTQATGADSIPEADTPVQHTQANTTTCQMAETAS